MVVPLGCVRMMGLGMEQSVGVDEVYYIHLLLCCEYTVGMYSSTFFGF